MRRTNTKFHREMLEMVTALTDASDKPVISVEDPPGLPVDPSRVPAMLVVQEKVAEYMRLHPDTIQGTPKRPTYSLEFVMFVLEVLASMPADRLSYGEISAATNIPVETVYHWIHRKLHRVRLR